VTGLSRVVRALPRDAHLLLLSSFLGSLPIGLLLVFFPLYLHDLGLRTLLIGGVFTAAPPSNRLRCSWSSVSESASLTLRDSRTESDNFIARSETSTPRACYPCGNAVGPAVAGRYT